MPTSEQDGISVETRDGTDADLRAELPPPPPAPPPPAVVTPAPVATPADEPDPASAAGKELAGKRKSMQDRIDQVTWEKHEERRAREKVEAELAALKTPKPTAAPETGRPRLKSFVDQIGTTYETYEDAADAHAEALTDFKLAARDQSSIAEQQSRGYQQAVHHAHTRGAETHADFDDVLSAFVAEGGTFDSTKVPAHQQGPVADLARFILDHPQGHSIAYTVASDRALYQRLIAAPTQMQFLSAMALVLSRLEAAPSGSAPAPAPVSKAKPPVKPVVGQPKATLDGPPGDDASDDEYRQWANAQERSRRRA